MIWPFKRKQALPSAEDCPIGSIARDAWDCAVETAVVLHTKAADYCGDRNRVLECAIQWANAQDMPFDDLRDLTACNLWVATREFAKSRRWP
jgi:hypothetical protein